MSIKRFASNLLAGKSLPLNEVEAAMQLYTPRERYTIDPQVAALKLGSSPDTLRAIQEALNLQHRIHNQLIDAGSFELDLLFNILHICTKSLLSNLLSNSFGKQPSA